MHFTRHRDSEIDKVIAGHMELAVKELLGKCSGIESIMLAGGFGRGEGSIGYGPDGIMPMGDYDIHVVTSKSIDPSVLKKISADIKKAINAPTKFEVDIDSIPIEKIGKLTSDISTYELKVASKVLYGKDLRDLICVKQNDVALSSGFITLSRRAIMLCKVLRKIRQSPLREQDRVYCVYQCSKVFTEICTALSLLEGFYEPSYEKRAYLFEKHFQSMAGLRETVPDLPAKVLEYTNYKIYSNFHEKTATEAFVEAANCIKPVFSYFIAKYLSLNPGDSWVNDFDNVNRRLRFVFLKSYVERVLKKYRLSSSPSLKLTIFSVQLYLNLVLINRIFHQNKRLYLSPLFSVSYPIAKTFMAANLAFYCIDVNSLEIDEALLRKAHEQLKTVYHCIKFSDDINWSRWATWEIVVDEIDKSERLCLSLSDKKSAI